MKLNTTASKLALLAAITALLCWVLADIGSLVRERQARQAEAARSVEQALAGPQTLIGPPLLRSCTESWTTPKGDAESRGFLLTAEPTQLDAGGELVPEARHRGLFKVNTYAGGWC